MGAVWPTAAALVSESGERWSCVTLQSFSCVCVWAGLSVPSATVEKLDVCVCVCVCVCVLRKGGFSPSVYRNRTDKLRISRVDTSPPKPHQGMVPHTHTHMCTHRHTHTHGHVSCLRVWVGM